MKKYLVVIGAILFASTAFGFGGAGTDREGNMVDDTQNVSRPAIVTILNGSGASRRVSLSETKRLTAISRDKTREETSSILQREKPRYRGSRDAMNTSIYREPVEVVEETLLERVHRVLKEKRDSRMQK